MLVGEPRSDKGAFVLYILRKDNHMKRLLSFLVKYSFWETGEAHGSGLVPEGSNLPPIPTGLSSSLAGAGNFPWFWFSALIIVLLALLLVWSLQAYARLKELVGTYHQCTADQLRFIRSLLDLCYVYRESPQVFLEKFKDKVNIREMKAYDLVGHGSDKRWKDLKEDERLLCTLLERGFTQRELCVVFNMKTINNLYIKHHRIRKKLASQDASVRSDTVIRKETPLKRTFRLTIRLLGGRR